MFIDFDGYDVICSQLSMLDNNNNNAFALSCINRNASIAPFFRSI